MVFKSTVLHFKIENTPIKDTNRKRKFKMLSFPFLDKQELFVTKLSFDEFTVERLWLVLNKTKTAKPLKKPQAYSILYVQGKHVFKIDFLLLFIKVSGTFFTF